jgi:hypothetical protein
MQQSANMIHCSLKGTCESLCKASTYTLREVRIRHDDVLLLNLQCLEGKASVRTDEQVHDFYFPYDSLGGALEADFYSLCLYPEYHAAISEHDSLQFDGHM